MTELEEQLADVQKPPELVTPGSVVPFVVGVQYDTARDFATYLTGDDQLAIGDRVVVEREGTFVVATVIVRPRPIPPSEQAPELPTVLHRATAGEIVEDFKLREKVLAALRLCEERVGFYGLPMKLIDALPGDGGKKIIFLFFAESRVDFRALVKELAAELHLRIELRQIGARDETRWLGCLGPCGMATCCSMHLTHFQPISIGMAKVQGLAPNPAKLTGMCGKLKCCLAFEHALYAECGKGLCKMGAVIETPKGFGKIQSIDILTRRYHVRLDSGETLACSANECSLLDGAKRAEREKMLAEREEARERRDERQRERQEKKAEKPIPNLKPNPNQHPPTPGKHRRRRHGRR